MRLDFSLITFFRDHLNPTPIFNASNTSISAAVYRNARARVHNDAELSSISITAGVQFMMI